MNRRQRNTRTRKRSNGDYSNVIALTLAFTGIAVLGILMYALFSAKSESAKIDSKTYCRVGTAEQITVVLIDHTDTINAVQRASLEKNIWDIAKSIPKNSVIEVYSVDKIVDHILEPEIKLCNPGDKSTVSDVTGNKNIAEKRYENKFKIPLNKMLNRLVSEKTLNESPIMESIQSVAVSTFIGRDSKSTKKELVLVSDLLQNSRGFTIYTGIPEFDAYKKSAHYDSVKSDLEGVEVMVLLLRRDHEKKLQNSQLWDLWTGFFESQGVQRIERHKIEG